MLDKIKKIVDKGKLSKNRHTNKYKERPLEKESIEGGRH